MPDLALYQPDIPQNTGTLLRLAACLGIDLHLIEPAGFPLSDSALKRAGMDYLERARLTRHISFGAFEAWRRSEGRRLILLTTKSTVPYTEFQFRPTDLLLMGRETSGVPEDVHETADSRLTIPMVAGVRSINMALSAGMALGEALRQTRSFPSHITGASVQSD
ncbi:tRNA (cytidine(34)-2'-O)-methyltransferase [Roseibium aquae]|uniref:tRNA (cytidine(34)-2'-O)-methyltransferase n=1 Tax=Roseibium aquae TaxID=1323746 RepID=A0A916T7Q6_9HYPH|nr:tRNA (cytidine(34)-2'-O)-methyltransferase [Roseibium aquae]GGB34829.1 tRNA (cytidine(34)-2'-O)-methyltransferase [Roseibium aquae]